MEDKQLAEYLRQYHLGEGGAATSRELERTFSVRGKELRDAVNRLRRRGIPIASSSSGYFYAAAEDSKYNRCYAVDTAAGLLESFIGQARDAYQALGLFGLEHCAGNPLEQDYKGKVLVMRPDTLRESCWDPRNMLWLAEGGFGCSPHARGQAVYATCLGDGEKTRWNRSDFAGVLDEQYLPDWAREKLEELRTSQQEQDTGPAMGGMNME